MRLPRKDLSLTADRWGGWGRWVYPALLAATIVWASGRSAVPGPGVPHLDKVVHFVFFGLLGTLVARARGLPRAVWPAVVLVSLFGALDEWRQSFTPGRSVEFADWLADTLGAWLAVVLYWHWGLYRSVLEWRLWGRAPGVSAKESSPALGSENKPSRLPAKIA